MNTPAPGRHAGGLEHTHASATHDGRAAEAVVLRPRAEAGVVTTAQDAEAPS